MMDERLKYWRYRADHMKEKTGKDFCVIEFRQGDYQPWPISVADHLPPMASVAYRTDEQEDRVTLQEGMEHIADRFNRVV